MRLLTLVLISLTACLSSFANRPPPPDFVAPPVAEKSFISVGPLRIPVTRYTETILMVGCRESDFAGRTMLESIGSAGQSRDAEIMLVAKLMSNSSPYLMVALEHAFPGARLSTTPVYTFLRLERGGSAMLTGWVVRVE